MGKRKIELNSDNFKFVKSLLENENIYYIGLSDGKIPLYKLKKSNDENKYRENIKEIKKISSR